MNGRTANLDSEVIFVFEESPEGGFEARAVGHCIFTQADTLEELRAEIEDAVRCHFDFDINRIVLRAAHDSLRKSEK
jgi:predicted RNase H-like HicB family nuclease